MVNNRDNFAWNELGNGYNTEFRNNLTPKIHEPDYAQNVFTPTNLNDDHLLELTLMQDCILLYDGIILLSYSKYSSPIRSK